ncbi:bifunctional glycosyltransferase family 2/GtrA family protein [Virgisporangium aurantiacum]|uniref:Polysaccharide synthesis protein GtrA n=1 Tax=Virgisporangium aurantiacum TaxID=175570 RepID=A0A8J3Z891_9ACTN|nr:bifunctional glycosyltransferase family 2/GtrA family protein [Virgisporangium aurantiacum]GIJ59174.1 polysaccharide synthesis protein GtrA [Virgisporangium aurantiacum]
MVLIPAYEPDARLLRLVVDLSRAAPGTAVVVVDDGSGPAYEKVFAAARMLGCTVLTHPVNRGKGAALKTGFRHASQAYPGQAVVCADADGQHRPADILAVADRVAHTGHTVLGVRRFTGPVPVRSRLGNALTRVLYTAVTGESVPDTQTGLRGYPPDLLGWLQNVPGERFEYEMRALLLAARAGHPVEQVPIATVYLHGNASSHFRPLVDSARVYAPLVRFAASSLLAAALDATLLFMLHALTGALLPSVLAARAVSSTVNFTVNRRLVFTTHRGHVMRYWALVAILALANYGLLAALTAVSLPLPAAKLVTDVVLFVVSFRIQRLFVFTSGQPVDSRRTATAGQMNTT